MTVVEKGPRLASREDDDVSGTVRSILQNEGIDIPASDTIASVMVAATQKAAVPVRRRRVRLVTVAA